MIKILAVFFIGTLFGAFICITGYLYWSNHKMTKVHKLEFPLILNSDEASKSFHLLPKGTTLYFDQAYSEGFTRYKVFINIDRMPLKLQELDEPTTIIPIEAYAIDKEGLSKLLQDYPLTKSDLISILKSGYISKEEIRELLAEYSK